MLFKRLQFFCLLFVISHILIFDYLNAMKVFTHHLDVWALWRNLHTENICSWMFLSIEQRPFTVWWLISSMWRQRGKNISCRTCCQRFPLQDLYKRLWCVHEVERALVATWHDWRRCWSPWSLSTLLWFKSSNYDQPDTHTFVVVLRLWIINMIQYVSISMHQMNIHYIYIRHTCGGSRWSKPLTYWAAPICSSFFHM